MTERSSVEYCCCETRRIILHCLMVSVCFCWLLFVQVFFWHSWFVWRFLLMCVQNICLPWCVSSLFVNTTWDDWTLKVWPQMDMWGSPRDVGYWCTFWSCMDVLNKKFRCNTNAVLGWLRWSLGGKTVSLIWLMLQLTLQREGWTAMQYEAVLKTCSCTLKH